jgi:serine/threonine protein kinase
MSFATVRDEHPDLPTAMERMATACCLSFTPSYCDEWLVREWRRQIEHAVQALGTGFAGLPEPIDFFYSSNGVTPFPEGVSRDEPVVVYQYAPGMPMGPYGDAVSPNFARELMTFILGIATVLKSVHEAGFVLRQIPLPSVSWNKAARRYSLRSWLGIAPIGPSNFHPRIGFPTVAPKWSAPECFDADAEVTTASDVYALGKTVLALLGHYLPNVPLLPRVHDSIEAVERRLATQLPDRVRRLLLLALHPHPRQRPRDMDQIVGLLFDGPDPRVPPTPPPPSRPPANADLAKRPRNSPNRSYAGTNRRPGGGNGGRQTNQGPQGGT